MGNANKKITNMMKKSENMMNSPVTITESVQIARGVAEDVVEDYHKTQGNVQLAISIQLEILKDIVVSAGLITAEEFKERYMNKAKEIQELQMKMMNEVKPEVSADMKVQAGDVEINKES